MSDRLDRALDAVGTFDSEANSPRDGWERGPDTDRFERWWKKYDGHVAVVVGLISESEAMGFQPLVSYWAFTVWNAQSEAIAEGESSRRGWAMDGADESAQTIH